jgi:hypothetical protein
MNTSQGELGGLYEDFGGCVEVVEVEVVEEASGDLREAGKTKRSGRLWRFWVTCPQACGKIGLLGTVSW